MAEKSVKFIVQELDKCKKNPIYFIENYVRLNIGGELVPMKLREKQKEIINAYLNDHYVIILGSRQTGKSMVTLAYILWLLMFFENYSVYILHKGEQYVKDHIRDVKLMYETLPGWMRYKVIKKSPLYLEFENNSRVTGVKAAAGKENDVGRGMRGGFIMIDEAAFQRDFNAILTGLAPTTTYVHEVYEKRGLPYGISIISTPNGKYNKKGEPEHFYMMWQKALSGENGYKPIKYHWTDVPEFRNDPNFKEKQLKKLNGDIRKYNQEYELVFLGNENTFLSDETILNLEKYAKDPEAEIELPHGRLYVYDYEALNNMSDHDIFLCGIDIGSQYGSDPSTMVFVRLSDLKVVADYSNKLKISNFKIDIVYTVLNVFHKKVLLAVERSPISEELLEGLADSEISDLILKDKKGKYGIHSNNATRPLVIDSLRRQVEIHPETVISKRLIQQLTVMERNPRTQKVEVPRGLNHHGDLAIAYGLVCYAKDYIDLSSYIYSATGSVSDGLEMLKNFIRRKNMNISTSDKTYDEGLYNPLGDLNGDISFSNNDNSRSLIDILIG